MPAKKGSVAAKRAAEKAAETKRQRGTLHMARSPENRKVILEAIMAGLPKSQAWRLARIAESTFYTWLNDDPSFALAIEHAFGVAMERKMDQLNALIATQQRGSATALMFWMERMMPEFKYRSELSVGMSDEDRRAVERTRELEEMDGDELKKLAKAAGIEAGVFDRAKPHRERAREASVTG